MTNIRIFAISTLSAVLSVSLLGAEDLSRYREFQLGMDLTAAIKQAKTEPPEAKLIHQRPAVIQELAWQPQRLIGPSAGTDPVSEVIFGFYNGELFRIVVNYDRYKTEGLTVEDMIESISANYGPATRPAAEISFGYADHANILARWEDSQYSVNLVRSSYGLSFAMVVFSKRLDAVAQAAITDAIRIEKEEAPQREIERQKKQDEETRVAHDKARLVNKPTFRP